MGSDPLILIALDAPRGLEDAVVGGKASKLARLLRAGFPVPPGFCLTTQAYETFVRDTQIPTTIGMELGRKSMDDMRWEEIWDAALRIRSAFLTQPLPASLREAIRSGLDRLDPSKPVAVRSSSVDEDSAGRSFAGLHESVVGVRGLAAVEDAVRVVWASLWSDAALLYRREIGLDPATSRMALIVQVMVDADRSGVAFARDPRDPNRNVAIVEAVPGPCRLLVDGLVDPDRWELDRDNGEVVAARVGQREAGEGRAAAASGALLEPRDLSCLLETLLSVEQLFGWPPDMEWTGRADSLSVLQARPITTSKPAGADKRDWYLTLRPGAAQLHELRLRVVDRLIPELAAEAGALAAEELDVLDDPQLADAIERRRVSVARWKKIYWDEFIPFAHGVRRLATYYNDAVQPEDPYEFVGLLRDQPLMASQRNRIIEQLARRLGSDTALLGSVEAVLEEHDDSTHWSTFRSALIRGGGSTVGFVEAFDELNERFLDIVYDDERLGDRPGSLLRNLVELSRRPNLAATRTGATVAELEARLLAAVGPEREAEAIDVMETGRVSWKLRDDDNLLVARLQSQSLRALELAAGRLRAAGRLVGDSRLLDAQATEIVAALREAQAPVVELHESRTPAPAQPSQPAGETPRQLIGQPASPGIATGRARCIGGRDDLGGFRQGEILVCDAIQPTMTHLVPLAGAIVERRGGMLIHGAIIARELGIPCVNGVRGAADVLSDGDLLTVDGHLGIVTVGAAEFDLESAVDVGG